MGFSSVEGMAFATAAGATWAGVAEHVRSSRNGVFQTRQATLVVARPAGKRSWDQRMSVTASSARPGPGPLSFDDTSLHDIRAAKKGAPPIMPAVLTASGPTDLTSLLFRNRIIFLGSQVNSQVAQRVISQLLTLAAIDEEEDIKMYINCPGGSTYSVLAIYDCMAWIKPKVSTVCFGVAASQGALLLAGGEKGKRFAMPNARIMIHQPQGGCGVIPETDEQAALAKYDLGVLDFRTSGEGTMDDVRRQVNEVMTSRDKIDKMYAAFTGQPVERVQRFTDRDRFFSASEAMEFGLIDGLLETEY